MDVCVDGSVTICFTVDDKSPKRLIGNEADLFLGIALKKARADALKNFGISHQGSGNNGQFIDKITLPDNVIIPKEAINSKYDILIPSGVEFSRNADKYNVAALEIIN